MCSSDLPGPDAGKPGRACRIPTAPQPDLAELEQVLKEHGAHHYSIFLDEARNLLFGYVEIESEERWNAVANTDVCQRWWQHMGDVMPSNPDNSPVSSTLREVFYLD